MNAIGIMMRKPNLHLMFIITMLIALPKLAASPADPLPFGCASDVSAQAIHPSGSPLLVIVKLTNTDKEPVPFAVMLGGKYPDAGLFKARITGSQGKVQEVSLSNDQGQPGSGGIRWLQPGESIDMPAMIEALPVGSYSIEVRHGKSAKITIKDDVEVARKWDEDLTAKVRTGDLFATHVAYRYAVGKHARPSFIDRLLQDLLSDSPLEVKRAAYPLYQLSQLPRTSEPIVKEAIRKHLRSLKEAGSGETSVLASLAALAGKVGTDEALECVLTLVRTPEAREGAMLALGSFKQEKATQELRLFLTDQDEKLQFRAAQRLAERKDAKALDVLLAVAHDPKSRWRMYSFDALLKYPGDPRVEPAIKSGLQDTDSQVRQSAEFALRQLANQKKKKP